jgi:hypothetical protein
VPICGTVSQISPPIRIVLVAAIALMAAWMLFLRPKTEEAPAPTPAPATAPGVTGLSKAVDKAKDAGAAQEARDAKVQKATGDDKAEAKPGKAGSEDGSATALVSGRVLPVEPLTEDQTKGLPKKVVRALDNRQVLVVGVFDTKEERWARMAADDRRVRRELAKANRYEGRVVVTQSSLGKLSSLNAVIGGLGVTQTPSVVVVDRNRKAVVLSGFVERNAINQAVQDARRNSIERRIKEPFVRQINETCANFFLRADRWNLPTSRAQLKPALRRWEGIMASYSAAFASLDAPAKYRGVRNQVANVVGKLETFGAALRSGNFSRINSSYTALLASDAGLNRKFADMGATSCNTDRRR